MQKLLEEVLGKYKIFIKSLLNINKKVICLCQNLWDKKYQVPLRDTAPLKLKKTQLPENMSLLNSPAP